MAAPGDESGEQHRDAHGRAHVVTILQPHEGGQAGNRSHDAEAEGDPGPAGSGTDEGGGEDRGW